ncbi:RHS repeat domain-containing protein [Vibrio algarum]|uniref:RHS repeat protein n=1 Tax=Vibrio algarum TaxID=3020714 RepID=A0ABT4YPW4_9VIBR|nr:hypothetical protein [Vibrio sp. KJ40-1]MDB1123420.1 hypothetical protein [Vibrio sp. KJ40-1]
MNDINLKQLRTKTNLALFLVMFVHAISGLALAEVITLDTKPNSVVTRKIHHYEKRERSDVREQHFLYSKNGLLAQKKSIYGFGKQTLELYQYDKSEMLVTRSMVKNGVNTSVVSYEYNSNGDISKETEVYPNGSRDERLYTYSEGGLLLALSLYVRGHQIEKTTYEYDSDGNRIFSKKYSKVAIVGTNVDTTHYEYNRLNQVAKAVMIGKTFVDDVVQSRQRNERVYVYDANHRLIKEENCYQSWLENSTEASDKSVSIKFLSRDSMGQIMKEQYMELDQDDSLNLVSTIEYQWQ